MILYYATEVKKEEVKMEDIHIGCEFSNVFPDEINSPKEDWFWDC